MQDAEALGYDQGYIRDVSQDVQLQATCAWQKRELTNVTRKRPSVSVLGTSLGV